MQARSTSFCCVNDEDKKSTNCARVCLCLCVCMQYKIEIAENVKVSIKILNGFILVHGVTLF